VSLLLSSITILTYAMDLLYYILSLSGLITLKSNSLLITSLSICRNFKYFTNFNDEDLEKFDFHFSLCIVVYLRAPSSPLKLLYDGIGLSNQ